MPPTRTLPPAKAVKTERTHEENQERAYIAASRRSDRSLEARVESARRASEIHKRRTGRSLRVTEQDVINEEMYEEEDDDLPLQYRRLTAHLQTGSVDFNRRLAAYLTNQVAMRSAMDQMLNNPYAQQFPNPSQFTPGNHYQPPMMNRNMIHSPTHGYRAAPYPSPHQPGFRQQLHNRSYSAVTPREMASQPVQHSVTSNIPGQADNRPTPTSAGPNPAISQPHDTDSVEPDPEYQSQTQSASRVPPSGNYTPLWQDMGPFSISLPPESQQLLAPALDPADPFSSMLMAGSESMMSNPYYPWATMPMPPKAGMSASAMHPSYNGMSATLAPSALDASPETLVPTTTASSIKDSKSVPSTGLDFNFGQESSSGKGCHGFAAPVLTRENSAQGLASGQITPADGFWDSFVQDGGWAEENLVS